MSKPCPSCGARISMWKLSASHFHCSNCGTPISTNSVAVYFLSLILAVLSVLAISMLLSKQFNLGFPGDGSIMVFMKSIVAVGLFYLLTKHLLVLKIDGNKPDETTSQSKIPEKEEDR